jgi:hypothetical protein
MKHRLLIPLAALSLIAVGCGKGGSKNPLKDFPNARLAEAPSDKKDVDQSGVLQSVTVSAVESDLNFVQGEGKSVRVVVGINGGRMPVDARYQLTLENAPQGMTLKPDGAPHTFVLSWVAPRDYLNSQQNAVGVQVEFRVQPVDTRNVTSKLLLSATSTGEIVPLSGAGLMVVKAKGQPAISGKVRFSPGQEVNAEQNVNIDFDVTAGGVNTADDVEVRLTSGPSEPARELLRMDALRGTLSSTAKVVQESVDAKGVYRGTYRVQFSAKRFLDNLIAEIETNPGLREKFESGKMKTAEAVFTARAENAYNGTKSADQSFLIRVNLEPKAGQVLYVGPKTFKAPAGTSGAFVFQLRSSAGRGRVQAALTPVEGVDPVTKELTCTPSSAELSRQLGCASVGCLLNCTLTFSSECSEQGSVSKVEVQASSKISSEAVGDDRVFKVDLSLTPSRQNCGAPPAKPETVVVSKKAPAKTGAKAKDGAK